ncbi:hypothetical protein FVE85_9120 [Porphyridium purpureum]|uniref:Dolichol kinase n=1 Tax=Porphyridium purpureum TaxID=35688 RepID=A0A5J4YNI0_PORPP|nr:hypothetical protein FVE85_9120 [Porphyridium purpureum]|eukprot:POR4611..scf222_8
MESVTWQQVVVPLLVHIALSACMVLSAEAMSKRRGSRGAKLHPQFVRKYMHIFASLQPLALMYFGVRRVVLVGLMIFVLLCNCYLFFFTRMDSLDDGEVKTHQPPENARGKSSPGTAGVVYFPVALLFSFWVMDDAIESRNTFIGVSMVLTLSLADGLAAIAGTLCARFTPAYRAPVGRGTKTLVGSVVCFCLSAIAILLASFWTKQRVSLVQLLLVSLASMLAEGTFSLGLDNLTQPLAVYLTLHRL